MPTGENPNSKLSQQLARRDRGGLMREFLAAFSEHANVAAAARKVHVSPTTIRKWRRASEESPGEWLVEWGGEELPFHEAVADAAETYRDAVAAEVHRRAVEGTEEELVFRGRKTGETVRRLSDLLLIFHAKRHIPEYRDNFQVEHTGSVVTVLDDSARARLADKLIMALERREAAALLPPAEVVDAEEGEP